MILETPRPPNQENPHGSPDGQMTMNVAIRACVYVVLGLVALVVWVPASLADLAPGPFFLPGLGIACIGLAIYLWTVWTFAFIGRGTPVPLDPPQTLVIRGLYRFFRNPMAFGFLLILIGEAIAFGAPGILIYAAVLGVAIQLFIVFIEEPGLKRRFGPPYEEYRRSVPRWFPRLSAFRPSRPDAHHQGH